MGVEIERLEAPRDPDDVDCLVDHLGGASFRRFASFRMRLTTTTIFGFVLIIFLTSLQVTGLGFHPFWLLVSATLRSIYG
jgi:hypothetical protein